MRPIFDGDTAWEGVVICTPWSYPSTRHALTVINISNQSPCCLNTCEPNFRWTREMQNWARRRRGHRDRGAQIQPNPDTQKQMLLFLSRLALKHDLEIRELHMVTFRTILVKYDEPLVQAIKGTTGLFVTKSKEGQRPTGEPHVYGWAAMMTALTTDPALSSEDKQKAAAYTSSANSLETLLQHLLEPVQKKNQKDWVKWQCSVDPQTQPILCLIINAVKARGAIEKFGQAPAGDNMRELQQVLDDL